MLFNDVLSAVDRLTLDEQEALIEIVRRRLAEEGRKRIVADIRAARQEFLAGGCRPATVDELIREISS